MAQIGACIGREFSYELLAAVSPLKGERLDEALEQLTKTGLVFRRGTPPDATYTFKHALVQDAAYDSLLKSKRAQLHAQIAQVLERDFSERVANEPELLAHHFTQAGLNERAVPYWIKAGQRALARVALAEAVGHLTTALSVNERLPASVERDRQELDIRVTACHGLPGISGLGGGRNRSDPATRREIWRCGWARTIKLVAILCYIWNHHGDALRVSQSAGGHRASWTLWPQSREDSAAVSDRSMRIESSIALLDGQFQAGASSRGSAAPALRSREAWPPRPHLQPWI